MEDNNRYLVYGNKRYAFDLDKIKRYCLVSDKEAGKESEILENYEFEEGAPTLVTKTSRTLKSTGNPQNDTIVYDMLKLFITTLLTNDTPIFADELGDDISLDMGTALALNTMLDMGFMYEIQ